MHTPRYNTYFLIHKALRAYMAHVLQLLGTCDWRDDEDTTQALAELRSLLMLCESHLSHENEFIHKAMESRAPGSTVNTAGQHHEHVAAIAALRAEVEITRPLAENSRTQAGAALYHHFSHFVAENLEHMLEEETANNAVLWAHYSDDEIRAIEQMLHASIGQPEKMMVLPWMLTSINSSERSMMVAGLRTQLPQPVFESVLAMLAARLSQKEWQKLQHAIQLLQPAAETVAA